MNAITPPKPIPPDHSTAASGTFPTEQTNVTIATSGPTITFSISRTAGGACATKSFWKKLCGSCATAPASKKPMQISFQSMPQSLRKLCATSDHASADPTRARQPPPCTIALSCWWPASACRACSRACSSSCLEMNVRSSSALTVISTAPPTNSASVNCQPSRIQITRPSSKTRFVEANWKAIALAALAPFWNRLLAIATAA